MLLGRTFLDIPEPSTTVEIIIRTVLNEQKPLQVSKTFPDLF